jgi:hypothetical protein
MCLVCSERLIGVLSGSFICTSIYKRVYMCVCLCVCLCTEAAMSRIKFMLLIPSMNTQDNTDKFRI